MVKIMLDLMLYISNYVVMELNISLENFAKNCLTMIQSGNVFFSIKHILNIFGCLSEVWQLPTETPTHSYQDWCFCWWISSNNLLDYC